MTGDDGARAPRAATRVAIFAATRELLLERGYRRLTIDAIAERAGVGKQTVYRWWPSKGPVVFDALVDADQGDGSALGVPDTGDFATDLRTLLRGTVAALRDGPTDRYQRTILAEVQHDITLGEALVTRLIGPQMRATAARIATAQAAGQVDAGVDPALAAELVFGPVFHRWALRTAPLDDELADRLAWLALRALEPGGAASRA